MPMPNAIEEKIRNFASEIEVIQFNWAMIKIGLDRGECPNEIMRVVIAHTLLMFHGISPAAPNQPTPDQRN